MKSLHGCVPKLHINGHNRFCQIFFSFIYEQFTGMTCGEGIESAWSEQNHAAAFTKEQNPGHRHDTLDDFNGYWNWTKLHQLCMWSFTCHYSLAEYFTATHLLSQWKKWSTIHTKKKASFLAFSETVSPPLLSKWKLFSTSTHSKSYLYEVQGNGTLWSSVLLLTFNHLFYSVMSQGQGHSSSSEQEQDTITSDMTEFIRRGLELELTQ